MTLLCEEVTRNGLRPCKNPAVWLTPVSRFRPIQRKVCGVHAPRYEDFVHRCVPLSEGEKL